MTAEPEIEPLHPLKKTGTEKQWMEMWPSLPLPGRGEEDLWEVASSRRRT